MSRLGRSKEKQLPAMRGQEQRKRKISSCVLIYSAMEVIIKANISSISISIYFSYHPYPYLIDFFPTDFIHLIILIQKMGNTCCQDQNVGKNISQEIESKFLTKNYSNQFYETDLPHDPEIEHCIAEIKQKETFALIFENHKVMKHKCHDKYYVGKWNHNREPEGLGVMFEPEQYIYHGEFKVVPNGVGTLELLKEKIIYEGQIKDGKADGQGKLTSRDNRIEYEGTMENSLPNTGTLKINNLADHKKTHTIQLHNFPTDPVKIHYEDGRMYEGFVNKRSFAPTGKGVAIFSDSSRYNGEWQQGEMHGSGEFYWKDGTSYNGEYQHGRKHGVGTFTYASKKRYEGHWVGGKQNGRGKLIDQNGKILKEGVWRDGVFEKEEH